MITAKSDERRKINCIERNGCKHTCSLVNRPNSTVFKSKYKQSVRVSERECVNVYKESRNCYKMVRYAM